MQILLTSFTRIPHHSSLVEQDIAVSWVMLTSILMEENISLDVRDYWDVRNECTVLDSCELSFTDHSKSN